MARKREQFMVKNIHIDDCEWENKWLVFDESKLNQIGTKSTKVLVSENRIFRKFSFGTESTKTLRRTENGRIERDEDGTVLYNEREVRSAKEFMVVNLSNQEKVTEIKVALAKGIKVRDLEGNDTVYKRLVSSASQTRVGKRLYTSLDIEEVRNKISFGAVFDGKPVIISKVEARYGAAESSTIEISDEDFTFDIMPDYEIKRKHDVGYYNMDTKTIDIKKAFEDTYTPLDGQGTILPSAAVRVAHRLFLISSKERELLLDWLEVYNEDVRLAEEEENEEFLRIWKKVPSALQIRFGFTKGLVLVYPHNLESTDCYGNTYRTSGKCMKYFNQAGDVVTEGDETRHEYDFSRDIMFTDSQWKENFNPKYTTDEVAPEDRVKLEIVLWQKSRQNDTIFMGYQYWQALNDSVSPKEYADKAIKELSDTIFTNADHAKAFLGMYDTGNDVDELGERMSQSGGKIQRVLELLNENDELIAEPYVQDTIRKTREKYISDMANGRIPVKGHNPYVVSSPEVQFGRTPVLQKGEYYFNGTVSRYAGFRSPLIDESEAVVINTIDVPEYHVLNKDILMLNIFDDIAPRMGGMDTDGDKIALVADEGIANAVQTGLPVLYDAGFTADPIEMSRKAIYEYDVKTIINDVLSIGEITNMATTWKDIMKNPRMMKKLKLDRDEIKDIVRILRFMQGWSIDYAKTGFFPGIPDNVLTQKSPEWKAWSKGAVLAGIKGAEVFKSVSPLGQLHKAVQDYMKNEFKRETKKQTRDFTFEFTAGADMNEVNRIKPVIKELEHNYRHELSALRDMQMTKEEESDYVIHLMDKYTAAVQSIDSDIRSIAAAAYVHTYFESSSKGNSISFPWVTAYEGLLLNISESTDKKTKLRKAVYNGHIDDIPATLKFYRNEATGENFTVSAKVPNGSYETVRHHGKLFVKMNSKSIAKAVEKRLERPVDTHVTFEIKGFKYAGKTPQQVIDLLKENDGIIRVQRENDKKQQVKEVRAVVYCGDERIGVVGRNNKMTVGQFLTEGAVELRVENIDSLKATYLSVKKNKEMPVSTFNFDMVVVGYEEIEVAEETEEAVNESASSEYYEEQGYYPTSEYGSYVPEETTTTIEMDLDDEDVPSAYYEMDADIYNRLNKRASYWDVDVTSEDFNIIGVSVETGSNLDYTVSLFREDGCKAVFSVIKDRAHKEFVLDTERNISRELEAFVLQVAHYELFADYIQSKEA